jgi:hypothetical protein
LDLGQDHFGRLTHRGHCAEAFLIEELMVKWKSSVALFARGVVVRTTAITSNGIISAVVV